MTVHEYCLIDDQPLELCQDPGACRKATGLLVKYRELIRISPYLTGWVPVMKEPGDIKTFQRGEFTIHLIGKRDIRVSGNGFSGEMRFYDAARKVMEWEENQDRPAKSAAAKHI